MATFSPIPSYVLGAGCFALTLHGLASPKAEYGRFGLPLERPKPRPVSSSTAQSSSPGDDDGIVSPLIHLKGLREFAVSISIIALQYQGNESVVTTILAVTSILGLGDGIIVWVYGGKGRQNKVWGHWSAFIGLLSWAWWRSQFHWKSLIECRWNEQGYVPPRRQFLSCLSSRSTAGTRVFWDGPVLLRL